MQDAWIVPDFPAPANVRAMVTTRYGPGLSPPPYARFNLGLRVGDEEQTVRANRQSLVQALDMPAEPRWLRQVHSTSVAELGPLSGQVEPCADAAVSRVPGTVLAILTADCLPLLLCGDDGGEIAAAHAGWRGLAAGIIEATVQAMASPPDRVLAWLGPCIGAPSYEVGDEVRAAFVDADGGAHAAFTATRPSHWQCDLARLARRRLAATGVSRIHGGGFDTYTDPRLYSYRRDGKRSGRFASLIWTHGEWGT
jgi:YfiH family protein